MISTVSSLENLVNTFEKPVVLFLPDHPACVPEMIYIAERISNSYTPVFWLVSKRVFDSIENSGYAAIYIPGLLDSPHSVSGETPVLVQTQSAEREKAKPRNSYAWFFHRFRRWKTRLASPIELRNTIGIVDKIIDVLKPKSALLQSDIDGFSIVSARLSNNKIPILLTPSVVSMASKSARILYREGKRQLRCSGNDSPLFNRFVASIWPNVVAGRSGKEILRHPAYRIFVEKLFGVYPDNPWHLGGGSSDYLALGRLSDRERYISYGVSPEKLILTGQLADDLLFKAMNATKGKAQNDPPLILYGISPLPEHNHITWGEHLKSITIILTQLKQMRYTLRLCLHPAHPKEKYLELAEKMNVMVETSPLLEVISMYDIYLTCHSSTIPWAIISQIPVINLDIYDRLKYIAQEVVVNDYIDYSRLGGVINIQSIEDIVPAIKRALDDQVFREQLKQSAEKYVRENVLFDGRAGERLYCAVVDMMVKTNARES